MLYNFFITFEFSRFCQSGCYFDFFYKKISEIFLRNFLIYGAQFFGEKYLIEVLTKKIFDNFIFIFNKYLGLFNLSYISFFLKFYIFIAYSIFFLNIFSIYI